MRLTDIRAMLAAVVVLAAPMAAWADEFLDRVNGSYATIRANKRSDMVLLPLVAKMDAMPASLTSIEDAMAMPAASSKWSAVEAWATAPAQKAVLEAVKSVAKEENPLEAMAFGQPYGADALATGPEGVALIRAKLYTELGDPPLLAGAKFHHLSGLTKVTRLVNVEATRRAAAGDVVGAVDVLVDWLFFARQMADRAMATETQWGLLTMSATLERIRDVVYVDFRSDKRSLTAEQIATILNRLREEGGYLRLDLLKFPPGDRIATEQVVDKTFSPDRGPDPVLFPTTMSRLASKETPLRLFAESSRWEKVASMHMPRRPTIAMIADVFSDWEGRWQLDPFDAQQAIVTTYQRTMSTKVGPVMYGVLAATVRDLSELQLLRQMLRTQLVGTRGALGLVAFNARAKGFPRDISGIRPTFVKVIEADPFNPDRANGKQPPLEFFVPIRDRKPIAGGDPAKPHEMNIVARGGAANFQVKVSDDQFILYSVGPNGAKDWAVNVTDAPVRGSIGDVLIWPPVTSLVRQHLIETGQIK
ncbi:MAG: hypothetical protein ACKVW3_13150 [Phycisphaerales bacterium]